MTRHDLPDPVRSKLRAAVADVEHDLERVQSPTAGHGLGRHGDELLTSWQALVELLALGPEPEYRDCPACQHTVMRDATVCGRCWTRLPPPAPAPPA